MPKHVSPWIYRGLDPWPRLHLLLETGSRGDHSESHRVLTSTPLVPARIPDPAFANLVTAARELVEAFNQPRMYFLGWVGALEVVGKILTHPVHEALDVDVEASLRTIEVARGRAVGELAALCRALEAVCQELGLPFEALLGSSSRTWGEFLQEVRAGLAVTSPAPEAVEGWREHLMAAWRSAGPPVVSGDPGRTAPWPVMTGAEEVAEG